MTPTFAVVVFRVGSIRWDRQGDEATRGPPWIRHCLSERPRVIRSSCTTNKAFLSFRKINVHKQLYTLCMVISMHWLLSSQATLMPGCSVNKADAQLFTAPQNTNIYVWTGPKKYRKLWIYRTQPAAGSKVGREHSETPETERAGRRQARRAVVLGTGNPSPFGNYFYRITVSHTRTRSDYFSFHKHEFQKSTFCNASRPRRPCPALNGLVWLYNRSRTSGENEYTRQTYLHFYMSQKPKAVRIAWRRQKTEQITNMHWTLSKRTDLHDKS